VVIDAGHGGTDPGAVSPDGKTYEKALTLDISKKLAAKIESACPDVKVVLSRPDDKFVALEDRASKANKSSAQLFISIHINSSRSSGPNGYSVHILGQSSNRNRDLFAYNMDVCKRENSVVLLENDYSTKYQGFDPSDPESFIFMQLMQNSHLEQSLEFAQDVADNLANGPVVANRGIWQNPFLVLWRTAMPAVLVELGFISNASDLSILRLESNRDKIAECLKNAFVAYKVDYDASVSISSSEATSEQPAPYTSTADTQQNLFPSNKNTDTLNIKTFRYGTQVLSGSKKLTVKDPVFAGYRPEIVKVGNIYKYIIGVSTSESEATDFFWKIRKTFPSSFMVKYSDSDSPAPHRPAAMN